MRGGGGERADARRRQQRCMAENRPQRCLDFYLRAVLLQYGQLPHTTHPFATKASFDFDIEHLNIMLFK